MHDINFWDCDVTVSSNLSHLSALDRVNYWVFPYRACGFHPSCEAKLAPPMQVNSCKQAGGARRSISDHSGSKLH